MFFVRTAGRRDLEAISTLLAQTWHDTYDRIHGVDKVSEITATWHSVEALDAQLEGLNSEFVVADDGTRIGGVAFAAMLDREKKAVMLHQLYVRPDCQSQGIGTTLLDEIGDAFPDATILRLEVEAANEKAAGFFEAKGFEKTGETSGCDVTGSATDAYQKRLR